MNRFLETIVTRLLNSRIRRQRSADPGHPLDIGVRYSEDGVQEGRLTIPQNRRAEHIAVLGKTGTGKSSLLRYLAKQDIEADRGFVYFDLHGDATPFLLGTIAAQERVRKEDLSKKLIVIDPADAGFSVGFNPLASSNGNGRFVQIAEFAQVLRQRWHLESFGARTDELLRNALYAITENGLTLLELAAFLTDASFRATCVRAVKNTEVRQYFESRYDQASEPMRGVMREPILNKISAFTADVHFRHIVGQTASTFSVLEAMDRGCWVALNLHKGRLGEQAATLGSLFLTLVKNALFSRTNRDLFTLYCDEIQNLVAFGSGLETVLSESRKFGVSVISANQFLDQYPPEMRSAILAVGTHVFFQLSSQDAQQMSGALGGAKQLTEVLRNLPRQHLVAKIGHQRPQQAVVPAIYEPKIDFTDLYNRCRARWARRRGDIEAEISKRQMIVGRKAERELDAWE